MDGKVISLFAVKKVEVLKPRWTAVYRELHRVDLLWEFCQVQEEAKKEGMSDEFLIRGLVICGLLAETCVTPEMRDLSHSYGRMLLLEALARGMPWNDPYLNHP